MARPTNRRAPGTAGRGFDETNERGFPADAVECAKAAERPMPCGSRVSLEATSGRGRETRRDDCGWCFTDNLL